MGKVVEIKQLVEEIKILRMQGKTIVTTNGCFDILHVGHVRYLRQTKSFADISIVLVNTDRSVRALKGPTRPINNENDRAEIISSLECVDFAILFDEDTPENLIAQIKPNVHTKGGDYTIETLPEAKVIMENGGRVEFISFVDGKSTTNIIEKAKL